MKHIDNLLNAYTMYRVVLYCLIILALYALILSAFGMVSFTTVQLLVSLGLLVAICFISNSLFAKMLRAPTNVESYLITALILFFILKPATDIGEIIALLAAGFFAMVSKYVLAIGKKHIFNPAAMAAMSLGLLGFGSAIWWIGTPTLLPIVMIVGFLVVRKIRRFTMFFTFLFAAFISLVIVGVLIYHAAIIDIVSAAIVSGPLLFFGTIMLTEPLTTPPTKKWQLLYGIVVGLLFGTQFQFGPIYSTPALALLLGNIFSYIVSPKSRLYLTLQNQSQLATSMREFVFASPKKLAYLPGQYLEWTLPHKHSDSRGNRRYFTIASSPTEENLKLGVKLEEGKSSSFKHHLSVMKTGDAMVASQLAGDFTLPKNPTAKLLFIAGGIGITPFRSMVQYLLDTNQKRDIVLLYTSPQENEFAYRSIFDQAQQALGIKPVYIITRPENVPPNWQGKTGRINEELLKEVVPDYQERLSYLSGPNAMVESYKKLLHQLGVKRNNIKADYFPGF